LYIDFQNIRSAHTGVAPLVFLAGVLILDGPHPLTHNIVASSECKDVKKIKGVGG